ncbi:UDP-N-acetylmuramoyl-tripeptide--D-alanyl-D-alanine ligase [Desulfonatronospira sp.]|uniref:UDP-N-acetylmuramoyl-tripeptide--D-alanyl-D- alanine ligase n=1 Tax=Desulfonatronospira sp. TaxID=1962951 RepID=UPI0025C05598|nr:UDP-N-acetylmuramoyl-tripeptide--D-alanyl-D-alanine ligase [Desulfonatronospira sp.]
MNLELQEAALAMQARVDRDRPWNIQVAGVQTDSRKTGPGELFFCLQGSRSDGHSYAGQAATRGAAGIVAHKELSNIMDTPVLMVDDTLKALGRLGRHWRQKAGRLVLGITGSAGKTTTKEILAGVLAARFRVGKNYRNWNNQLGLPLSLCMQSGDEDFWVMELGINNHQDMDRLGEILLPDAALILNVGPCHLEGLGDVAGVASAKARLLDHIQAGGKAYINMDYPELKREAGARQELNITWFSRRHSEAGYRVIHLQADRFLLHLDGQEISFTAPVQGAHLCENLAAVWAVSLEFGMQPGEIKEALKKAVLPEQRMSVSRLGDWTVIDDSYNANPMSMQAALETARSLASGKDLVLVLGDMAELGPGEALTHAELGRTLCRDGFTALFYHGDNLQHVMSGMNGSGSRRTLYVQDTTSFQKAWEKQGCSGGVILFKGSRRAGMEKFVQAFKHCLATPEKTGS